MWAKSNLQKRVNTAIVLIGAFVAIALAVAVSRYAAWAFSAVGVLLAFYAALEVSEVITSRSSFALTGLTTALVLSLPVCITFVVVAFGAPIGSEGVVSGFAYPVWAAAMIGTAVLLIATVLWTGRRELHVTCGRMGELLIAMILVGAGGGALLLLTFEQRPVALLGWLSITVCSNDIAAFVVGKRFGKTSFAPAISPKKTIEGALGGLIAGTALGSLTYESLLGQPGGIVAGVFLSLLVVVAAQTGDIAKSLVKRLHGVKDMGRILPGHGGVLDRFDGFFGAAPVLVAWIVMCDFVVR